MKTPLMIILALSLTLGLHGQVMTTFAGRDGFTGSFGDGGPAADAVFTRPQVGAIDANGNVYITDAPNVRVRVVNAAGIISTFAGNGTADYTGDGGPATDATFFSLNSTAVDGRGNLYISDGIVNRIRRVDASGIITTFAGSGTPSITGGYSGDGGPATLAQLYSPGTMAVDAAGNLYFVDEGNYRVRKVDIHGTITTVAGNGISAYSGDNGPATIAELGAAAIAIDAAGNIYISDATYSSVRKINTSGIISLYAGAGPVSSPSGYSGDGGPATAALLNAPDGLATDRAGNLYICDNLNLLIRKVNTSGIISTVAGTTDPIGYGTGDGGPATAARLLDPTTVAIDTTGNIYIADGNDIRKVIINGVAAVKNIASGANAPHVFPNPIAGNEALYINSVASACRYCLCSMIGAELQAGNLLPGNNKVFLPDLAPGIYTLQITGEDGQKMVKKIIKQ